MVHFETKSSYYGLWGIYETAGADHKFFIRRGGGTCKLSLEIFQINIKGREKESDKVVNSNMLAFQLIGWEEYRYTANDWNNAITDDKETSTKKKSFVADLFHYILVTFMSDSVGIL